MALLLSVITLECRISRTHARLGAKLGGPTGTAKTTTAKSVIKGGTEAGLLKGITRHWHAAGVTSLPPTPTPMPTPRTVEREGAGDETGARGGGAAKGGQSGMGTPSGRGVSGTVAKASQRVTLCSETWTHWHKVVFNHSRADAQSLSRQLASAAYIERQNKARKLKDAGRGPLIETVQATHPR